MSLARYAAVLDAVRGLGWPALRRVRSAVPGPHVSTVRGTTAEFVEYRPYRQGDEPRRIDWKLLARTDRVHVRLSQERAILPSMIVLDASESMAFPKPAHAKYDLARQLAIGLAAVARHRGDPVGLAVAAAAGTVTVAPRTRRTVLDEMMHAVDGEPGGSAALAPALAEAARRATRVVLVSDFLDEDPAWLARARAFAAAGGELYAVHVIDPQELDPGHARRLVADPEAPEVRRPLSPAARAEYVRRFTAWREELARDLRAMGAVYAVAVPGEEPLRQTIRRITTPQQGARSAAR
ncbi:MAG TPA: DUF58 domain-containing protein [Gemmatimonadaceae bacterium]|nr:DUF58 domain-containing protein [Gemmatimonadaceae bacterium]